MKNRESLFFMNVALSAVDAVMVSSVICSSCQEGSYRLKNRAGLSVLHECGPHPPVAPSSKRTTDFTLD